MGDACDACPLESNLGGKPCASTIYKVKDGTEASGKAVALAGVVCTVVGPDFFTVQVKDATEHDFSALYVYTKASGTKCVPGTVIDLQGTVELRFGQTELTNPVFVTTVAALLSLVLMVTSVGPWALPVSRTTNGPPTSSTYIAALAGSIALSSGGPALTSSSERGRSLFLFQLQRRTPVSDGNAWPTVTGVMA